MNVKKTLSLYGLKWNPLGCSPFFGPLGMGVR